MTVMYCMIPVPFGEQRDGEPSMLGIPLGAHAVFCDFCLASAEGITPELALPQGIPYPYSYPRGRHRRIPYDRPPLAVTIRGNAEAADFAPPVVGMSANWCGGPKSST